jgi:hypothetical protein
MTGNPGGPMNVARIGSDRSHARGERHWALPVRADALVRLQSKHARAFVASIARIRLVLKAACLSAEDTSAGPAHSRAPR